MLYMVECRFRDAVREQAWNDWYSGERLGELLSVPGFRTSQRFTALTRPATYYLAVHSIDSLCVFETPEYKAMGGGGFEGYQDYITDWKRQFFEGLDIAPPVRFDECLVVADSRPERVRDSGMALSWMRAARKEQEQHERGIAVIKTGGIDAVALHRTYGLDVYQPIMTQRVSAI